MKTKTIFVVSSIFFFSFAVFSATSALGIGEDVNVNANINVRERNNLTTTTSTTTTTTTSDNTISNDNNKITTTSDNTIRTDNNLTATTAKNDNVTSTSANDNGQLTAETHRSTVASYVKSLLDIANREGGIGSEVRLIAQAQNDSASTSVEAIAKIEGRSALKTFLIGSDYKNLGQLRSEISKTQNNTSKLKNLQTRAISDATKTDLAMQIKALDDSQIKLDTFVKANENSFSLFGWFVKLFSK